MLMTLATESARIRSHCNATLLPPRNYDTTLGRFTSFDTFDGHLDEPLTLNKYIYAASDPVNNVDPSGHDFELGELLVNTGISNTLTAFVGGAVAPVLHQFAVNFIPPDFIQRLLANPLPDAVRYGFGYSGKLAGIPALSGSAGLDVVVSPDRGNAAIYAYAGAALMAGRSSSSAVGYVGGLFGIHNSSEYQGVRARISVGLYQLPASLRGPIKNALLQVALAAAKGTVAPLNTGSSVGGSLDFVRQIGRANARLAVAVNQLVNNSGISIDFPIGDPSGPIGISLAINFTGASAFETRKYGNASTSFSVATYLQLYPSQSVGL